MSIIGKNSGNAKKHKGQILEHNILRPNYIYNNPHALQHK